MGEKAEMVKKDKMGETVKMAKKGLNGQNG